MQIKVIKVELDTTIEKANNAGTYKGHKLVFEDGGNVKTKGFHEKVLGFRTDLKEAIEGMQEGQWYEVQMEKNDKGYWDWVSINPSDGSTQKQNQGSQRTSPKQGDTTGVAVGHAVSNAVALCAAMGEADKEKIKEYAYMIYDISLEMQDEIRNGTRDKGKGFATSDGQGGDDFDSSLPEF